MKKLFAVIICIVMLFTFANAETDLSSMAYDDLISMYHELVKEIMSRPEWKEVNVPAGVWIGGQDIPVGSYSITATTDSTLLWIENEKGHDVIYEYYGKGETVGKITIEDGYTIHLKKAMIFAPVASLGF